MNNATLGKIIAYMVVLFIAGAVVGALVNKRITAQSHPTDIAARIRLRLAPLQLTPDQQAKIDPLVQSAVTQMQVVRIDSINRFLKIDEALDDQIAAVLTPDQQAKLQTMEQRHRDDLVKKYNLPPEALKPKHP